MNKDRHQYHDPEDDSCSKGDAYERMLERADYLRDERKDREIDKAIDESERRRKEL